MSVLPFYPDERRAEIGRLYELPPLEQQAQGIQPVSPTDQTRNALRPHTFEDVIGQETAVRLMRQVLDACIAKGLPLDHVLLVGASGTGKSTFSHVIANELGVDIFKAEAPVSLDTLLELREVMRDGDILRIEEIHQQAIMERRGRGAATQPEVLYEVLEDRTITTGTGVLPYPHITVIGTTTDEGMLPEAFLNRFPLQPHLDLYSPEDMQRIAVLNARQLDVTITGPAARRFAQASRGVPRQVNNLMRNAALMAPKDRITVPVAKLVVRDMNRMTDDGLTADMQHMLVFLYTRARREKTDGEVSYQASVNTIATAIGKSRDSKAIALRVEPHLIERGYIQVGHGGRTLTPAGVERARSLL